MITPNSKSHNAVRLCDPVVPRPVCNLLARKLKTDLFEQTRRGGEGAGHAKAALHRSLEREAKPELMLPSSGNWEVYGFYGFPVGTVLQLIIPTQVFFFFQVAPSFLSSLLSL